MPRFQFLNVRLFPYHKFDFWHRSTDGVKYVSFVWNMQLWKKQNSKVFNLSKNYSS